jgi:hypothetical protein
MMPSMPDPVSWYLIEPGWSVVAADDAPLGTVVSVFGATSQDIFDGLAVSAPGHAKPKYVEADFVGRIVRGLIHLRLTTDGFAALEGADAPAGADVERA